MQPSRFGGLPQLAGSLFHGDAVWMVHQALVMSHNPAVSIDAAFCGRGSLSWPRAPGWFEGVECRCPPRAGAATGLRCGLHKHYLHELCMTEGLEQCITTIHERRNDLGSPLPAA